MWRIAKKVTRYGVMNTRTNNLVERGINNVIDARHVAEVYNSSSVLGDKFIAVETTTATVVGTKPQIETWLGRGIETATTVNNESALLRCPPFKATEFGYGRGDVEGITHDPTWFAESVLKGKGTNLLKRLGGTKVRGKSSPFMKRFESFVQENPLATRKQLCMFARRSGGLSRKQANAFVYNMKARV